MEPALTQFESKYKNKINIAMINVDEKSTPEYKLYGQLEKLTDSIPFTVWVDSKGKVIDQYVGTLTDKELATRSDNAKKKAK